MLRCVERWVGDLVAMFEAGDPSAQVPVPRRSLSSADTSTLTHARTHAHTWLTSGWDFFSFFYNLDFEFALGGVPGCLLGGRLGVGNTAQDHSFYPIKYQPDWLHLTLIHEGFWLGSWACKKSFFSNQPDVSHETKFDLVAGSFCVGIQERQTCKYQGGVTSLNSLKNKYTNS